MEQKPLALVYMESGDGRGFWDQPRPPLHLNGFRHPSPPNPRPQLNRRSDLNRCSSHRSPAPTPRQAGPELRFLRSSLCSWSQTTEVALGAQRGVFPKVTFGQML